MSSWWKYSCSGCDFRQVLNPLGNTGYWSDEKEYITLWLSLAWCQKCQEVTRAELLRSPEEIRVEHDATRTRRTRRDLERYLGLLERRRSPPRCLRCGSTEIIYASSDRSVVHPSCGGVLSASLSELRGQVRACTHLYTFEGEFLETVDGLLIPWNGLDT